MHTHTFFLYTYNYFDQIIYIYTLYAYVLHERYMYYTMSVCVCGYDCVYIISWHPTAISVPPHGSRPAAMQWEAAGPAHLHLE